jgi:NAD(P)-dependent dehydrogenase (short-subunit alcohol dehydrogenase family)
MTGKESVEENRMDGEYKAPGPAAAGGTPPPAGLRRAFQVGMVVRNLERTMAELTAALGIGPFRVVECPPAGREDRQSLRGAPARFRTRQAFADLGSVELELIQPLEGRTIWSEFLERRGPGLHHIRFNDPDLDAVTAHLRSMGYEVTQEGAGIREGTYWINFDTEERVGFTVEVMRPAPGTDGRTPGAGGGAGPRSVGSEEVRRLFDLGGRTAIVTGASRGLGRRFALTLARAGADVVVTARETKSLAEVKAEIEAEGRRAWAVALDVRDRDGIARMAEEAIAAAGSIDIIVNNAGCNIRKRAVDLTWEDWNTVLDTNLRGAFFVAQAIARHMIPRGKGRVINIGSGTCVFGYAGIAPYCASRGGIRQLTMSLADDWGPHGITVNCLAPGWFETRQTAALFEDREWREYICDRLPLKRPGKIEELDGALLFLASDASSYVTGQTLLVDGGFTTGATRATGGKPAAPPGQDSAESR